MLIYLFWWEQPGDPRHGYGAWTERDSTIYRVWGCDTAEGAEAAVRGMT